jgi:plasmid stabilization system protein ParE
MKKHTPVTWRPRAKRNLAEIKRHIAQDAPKTALNFIRRLKEAVNVLRAFPEGGAIVEELNDPEIREVLYGVYRIIYRFDGRKLQVLTLVHGARLLRPDLLERD